MRGLEGFGIVCLFFLGFFGGFGAVWCVGLLGVLGCKVLGLFLWLGDSRQGSFGADFGNFLTFSHTDGSIFALMSPHCELHMGSSLNYVWSPFRSPI